MKFITDKIEWTQPMCDFAKMTAERKLARITDNYNELSVTLSKLNTESLKVNVSLDSFRAQSVDTDFYAAVVSAINKLQSIITKHSKKQISRNKERQISMADLLPEEVEFEKLELVTKEKLFELQPISLEAAIDEFEKTDYNFYVFKDEDYKGVVSIIYKRLNNTYGVIRCK